MSTGLAIDPDILIVLATLVTIFAFSSALAGWVSGRLAPVATLSLGIGIGLFIFVHMQLPEGLTPVAIPLAFIHIAAMILGN